MASNDQDPPSTNEEIELMAFIKDSVETNIALSKITMTDEVATAVVKSDDFATMVHKAIEGYLQSEKFGKLLQQVVNQFGAVGGRRVNFGGTSVLGNNSQASQVAVTPPATNKRKGAPGTQTENEVITVYVPPSLRDFPTNDTGFLLACTQMDAKYNDPSMERNVKPAEACSNWYKHFVKVLANDKYIDGVEEDSDPREIWGAVDEQTLFGHLYTTLAHKTKSNRLSKGVSNDAAVLFQKLVKLIFPHLKTTNLKLLKGAVKKRP